MNNGDRFDFIIIGTGAGGGTLAWKLAPSGKRILLLERGPFIPREKDNWSSRAVNVEGKYQTRELWRDRNGNDLHRTGARQFCPHGYFQMPEPGFRKLYR
jgi:choline dehydrogenase-like flavoprotein